MNRYLDDLNDYANKADRSRGMARELAHKISEQRAQPLTEEEKRMIRVAVSDRGRRLQDKVLDTFLVGGDADGCMASQELRRIFDDLMGKEGPA